MNSKIFLISVAPSVPENSKATHERHRGAAENTVSAGLRGKKAVPPQMMKEWVCL